MHKLSTRKSKPLNRQRLTATTKRPLHKQKQSKQSLKSLSISSPSPSQQLPHQLHSHSNPLTSLISLSQPNSIHTIHNSFHSTHPSQSPSPSAPGKLIINDEPIKYHPLNVNGQIKCLFPEQFEAEIGFNPYDLKHLSPPQRLSKKPGLWGLKGIKHPNDLDTLYLDKVHQIEARATALLINPTSTGSLQLIDDMSKLLCDIADMSEAIRSLHMAPNYQRKANSLHMNVQELLQRWSSSPIVLLTLYNILRTKSIWDSLTLEGRRIILDLSGRMNMSTIVAADDYAVLPPLVYNAEGDFVQTETDSKWITIPTDVVNDLSPEDRLTLARQGNNLKFKSQALHMKQGNNDGNQSTNFLKKFIGGKNHTEQKNPMMSIPTAFYTDPSFLHTLLTTIHSRKLRKLLYKYLDQPYTPQLSKLQDLIKYRHIFALAQGHLSYAHSVNASLMSKSPIIPITVVSKFLDKLAPIRLAEYRTMASVLHAFEQYADVRGRVQSDEIAELQKATAQPMNNLTSDVLKTFLLQANQNQGNEDDNNSNEQNVQNNTLSTTQSNSSTNLQLHASDIPYAINQIKNLTNTIEDELTKYLRLDHILQGIGLICNVMDVRLEAHLIRPGEGWGARDDMPIHPSFTQNQVEQIYSILPPHNGNVQATTNNNQSNTNGTDTNLNRFANFTNNINNEQTAHITPVNNSTYHHAVHQLKQPGTWCHIEHIDQVQNHHLIMNQTFKLHFVDKTSDELLGVLYIDPYARNGKHDGGAQYVIGLGRMAHDETHFQTTQEFVNHKSHIETDDEFVQLQLKQQLKEQFELYNGQDGNNNGNNNTNNNNNEPTQTSSTKSLRPPTRQHEYELPTTVLTTAIHVSPPSITGSKTNPTITLPQFSGSNMRLLAHEIGHAAHAILNRTQFQHFSGPRCEMDFVETPSTLFEILCEDPQFINLFARHHVTGAQLPKELIDALDIKNALFPVHNITTTGVLSLLDLHLFGPEHNIQTSYDVTHPFHITQKLTKLCSENENGLVDTKSIQNIIQSINIDQYRPMSVLERLYKTQGIDIKNIDPSQFESIEPGTIMNNILTTYQPPHAQSEQTILQAHAIYRRYGNIDIHENGPGVVFDDMNYFNNKNQQNITNQQNSVNNDINSTNIDNHFTITALNQSTQVYPHADHSHLSHYGGFYFSYLYSRAFAHLIKSHLFDSILQTNNNMKTLASIRLQQKMDQNNNNNHQFDPIFDQVLPTSKEGLSFRRQVLQSGGSQVGLDIMADFLQLHQQQDQTSTQQSSPTSSQKSSNPSHTTHHHDELTTQQHQWPQQLFALPFQENGNDNDVCTTGVISDIYLCHEQLQHRQNELTQWNAMKRQLPQHERESLPSFPPFTNDLSTIYATLTEFQHQVGWKVAANLPEQQQIDQFILNNTNNTKTNTNKTPLNQQQYENDHDDDNSTFNALTPLQQKVLDLAFDSFETHIVEQSQRGLKHIHDKLGI